MALSGTWWLIVASAAASSRFLHGRKHPYAMGVAWPSELMVFVFFGLLACVGTAWTQVQVAPWWLWILCVGAGFTVGSAAHGE